MEKLLYSAVEAARILNVSRATVYVLINEGKLKPVHIGRLMRLHIDELRRFVDSLVAESSRASTASTESQKQDSI